LPKSNDEKLKFLVSQEINMEGPLQEPRKFVSFSLVIVILTFSLAIASCQTCTKFINIQGMIRSLRVLPMHISNPSIISRITEKGNQKGNTGKGNLRMQWRRGI
jgi:hypothetical protein